MTKSFPAGHTVLSCKKYIKPSTITLSHNFFTFNRSDTESDESDESDVEYLGTLKNETVDITEDDDFNSFMESCGEQPQGPMKVKGEFGIEDLPPIEELTITVPESECIQLGTVSGIVETLGKIFGTCEMSSCLLKMIFLQC